MKRTMIQTMIRTMTVVLLAVAVLAIYASAADASLKGKWKATSEQAFNCDKPAAVQIEHIDFEIEEAPFFKLSSMPSFNYSGANVSGAVKVQIHLEHQRYPETIISGVLVGAMVKNAKGGLTLQGYILSKEEYGTWLANKKHGVEPGDAGEVELEVLGNALQGYTLNGVIRSGESCTYVSPLSLA